MKDFQKNKPNVDHGGMLPPQAVELEEAVLGMMLLEDDAVDVAMSILHPDDFYRRSHQMIFAAFRRLRSDQKPTDILSVEQYLRVHGELDEVGGPGMLSELTRMVSGGNVEYHSTIIREAAAKRRAITKCAEWTREAYVPNADIFELLSSMEQGLTEIQALSSVNMGESVADITDRVLEEIESRRGKRGLTGVPSGFRDLDGLTAGWQNSDLIIVAARPGMGKTALTVQMAHYAADNFGKVGIFSLEMSASQLVERLLSQISFVPLQLLKKGMPISPEQSAVLTDAANRIKRENLVIDDRPGLSITEMRSQVKRWKREYGIRMVVVDYIQLAQGDRGRQDNREQEISQISRGLKAMAKECNIPVIALSQLSRAVEQRGGDKRPMLSDLRESGAIEQDADQVIFLFRPEYYNIQVDDNGDSTAKICEVIVAKSRHGVPDTVKLIFDAEYVRFGDKVYY